MVSELGEIEMTIICYHLANRPNCRGSYTVPNRRVEETRAFLAERGYVVYREVVR